MRRDVALKDTKQAASAPESAVQKRPHVLCSDDLSDLDSSFYGLDDKLMAHARQHSNDTPQARAK